jgi:hypothetical protein
MNVVDLKIGAVQMRHWTQDGDFLENCRNDFD